MKSAGVSSVALFVLIGLSSAHPQGTRDVKGATQPGRIVVTETSLKEATEAPQVVVYVNEEGTALTTTTETVRISEDASFLFTSTLAALILISIGVCLGKSLRHRLCALHSGKYSVVRTYGTDCEQITKALPAAKRTGLKLILGLFDIGPIEDQVQAIITAVAGDWSSIDTVSVGNELVNSGKATAEQVITAMTKARTLLRAAGYAGPVVTVDTFMAVLTNPSLCDASDYCAMNIHPFFDKNTAARDAGLFVTRIVSQVQAKLSDRNKRVVCTETGWPWQGDSNGAAVPGVSEQRLAVDSIKEAFASHPGDVILFSAFNDLWKHSDASTFHAEKYWGIGGGLSGSSK
ncbi:cell wall glucanase [Colletotrichum camelliae]|nr:cell wall glucanase [Colletotrichum camelliae]